MNWQLVANRDNMAQTLEKVFAGWHQRCFANSPNVHPGLSVEIRDLQEVQDW